MNLSDNFRTGDMDGPVFGSGGDVKCYLAF